MRPREYSDHVVTFIDVLGFKNLVNGRSAEEVGQVLTLLQEMTQSTEYERFVMGRGTVAFSDSIVRASALQTPSDAQSSAGRSQGRSRRSRHHC
jgi:hypothetical protein